MASPPDPTATGLFIFVLTAFLDALELSFARMLWFVRTLRFWLYFVLHFGLSCLVAYLLSNTVSQWFLLGPLATFLGVAVISNTDVKVAGQSLVPIAQLFLSIKAKMFEQAAEEKGNQVLRAELIERLQRLPVVEVEGVHRAGLMGAGQDAQRKEDDALKQTGTKDEKYKSILISQLIKANLSYVQQNIAAWERDT